MFPQIFRHGIDIGKHHLKGVYVCTLGKSRKQSSGGSGSPTELICTLREGRDGSAESLDAVRGDEKEEDEENNEEGAAEKEERRQQETKEVKAIQYGPITLSYQNSQVTLRPWDPYACVIAAGIHNRLIHFPIRPGSRVFVLGCSLQTLSHIADIVGPTGGLVGVIGKDHRQRPSRLQLARFRRAHRTVSVIEEDIENASLERYERMLSLPLVSKHAFLMALHPKLGQDSPARILKDDADPKKIFRRIFSFVECEAAAKAKCLVVCHWPPGTHVDVVREVVLSHIDILRRWRAPKGADGNAAAGDNAAGSAIESTREDGLTSGGDNRRHDSGQASSGDEEEEEETTAASDVRNKQSSAQASRSKSKSEVEWPHWVLLDLPTDNIVTGGGADKHSTEIKNKLTEVVDSMKRLTSGLRTGLLAKEQLLLPPYFPNHALLLLKYATHRDECKGSRRKFPTPPGLADAADGASASASGAAPSDGQRPPSKAPTSNAIPMPAFGSKFGGGMPAPPDAPSAASSSGQASSPAAPNPSQLAVAPSKQSSSKQQNAPKVMPVAPGRTGGGGNALAKAKGGQGQRDMANQQHQQNMGGMPQRGYGNQQQGYNQGLGGHGGGLGGGGGGFGQVGLGGHNAYGQGSQEWQSWGQGDLGGGNSQGSGLTGMLGDSIWGPTKGGLGGGGGLGGPPFVVPPPGLWGGGGPDDPAAQDANAPMYANPNMWGQPPPPPQHQQQQRPNQNQRGGKGHPRPPGADPRFGGGGGGGGQGQGQQQQQSQDDMQYMAMSF